MSGIPGSLQKLVAGCGETADVRTQWLPSAALNARDAGA
jgi:hypothetical protein